MVVVFNTCCGHVSHFPPGSADLLRAEGPCSRSPRVLKPPVLEFAGCGLVTAGSWICGFGPLSAELSTSTCGESGPPCQQVRPTGTCAPSVYRAFCLETSASRPEQGEAGWGRFKETFTVVKFWFGLTDRGGCFSHLTWLNCAAQCGCSFITEAQVVKGALSP